MAQLGLILWEGFSRLDGAPIAVIYTHETANDKTGDMGQTWIIRTDIEPHHAVKTGADQSVCGTDQCIHRVLGSCYVVVFQAPLAVYRAYHRGSYKRPSECTPRELIRLAGKKLRIGSYGDPLAAPYAAWKWIIAHTRKGTGYTHQWKRFSRSPLRAHIMASVDNVKQAMRAHSLGWRTFRARAKGAPLLAGEIVCANESHDIQCTKCVVCTGATNSKGKLIKSKGAAITVHGANAGAFDQAIIAKG